jgi:hypothetical protein
MQWSTLVRRVVERHWSARFLLLTVLSLPGMVLIKRGQHVAGAVAILIAVAITAFVSLSTPQRRLAALERAARASVPAGEGDVVLVGVVTSAPEMLAAPRSKAACVAYWQRTLMDSDGVWAIHEEATRAVDFGMQCGDTLIAVDASRATILFDPARATWTHEEPRRWRDEEASAGVGDLILVAGRLVRGPDDGPFRASARITARKRPVVIGLIAHPGDRKAV